MTTLVTSPDFSSFCATHRVEAWKRNIGQGTVEVRWTSPVVDDPEQRAFDKWELGQEPRFSWEIPKQTSGQPPGNW